jgi:hypothetical protein
MAEQTHGPVSPQELLAIAAGAPPEVAGRLRRAADQLAAFDCPPSGAGRIFAERLRQVRIEGFGYAADDAYRHQQLARAATCYALPHDDMRRQGCLIFGGKPDGWPWPDVAWKPGHIVDLSNGESGIFGMPIEDRIRELEKAGALCAAEIDRLVRLQHAGGTHV